MIKRFIEWMEYMGQAQMTELSAKDEILMCVVWVFLLALIASMGFFAEWLENKIDEGKK